MEASEFGNHDFGPEPEPTWSEWLDALLFPSSPERMAINMAIFAAVAFGILALVLAGKS